MKPKIIDIACTQDNIFKRYLHIINGVLSDRKLTNLEIEVLDKMLLIDYIYRKHPKEKRDKIIFNIITKCKIIQELNNISMFSYNNILTKLRKKGFIKGNSLMTFVNIVDNKIEITFKLEIK